jgi:Two component regulator propeller
MFRYWSVCSATSREAPKAIRVNSGKAAAFAFVMIVPAIVSAQSKSSPISLSEYQKQEWHVEDGLPQGNVRAITQAPDRSLMIGTSEGVASFDGIRFTLFPLHSSNGPNNEPVNAILYSRSGELWIGTDDRGVLVQRGQAVVAISEDSGFHGERIRALHEDKQGNIWAATQNGIEKIHDGKIEALYSMGPVSGDLTAPFAEDGNGNVFIVTSKGVFVWDGGKATSFSVSGSSLGSATAIYGDNKGTIWVGRRFRTTVGWSLPLPKIAKAIFGRGRRGGASTVFPCRAKPPPGRPAKVLPMTRSTRCTPTTRAICGWAC